MIILLLKYPPEYTAYFFEWPCICSRYLNVTDRQTDGRLTIAIPRFALHASRDKNRVSQVPPETINSSFKTARWWRQYHIIWKTVPHVNSRRQERWMVGEQRVWISECVSDVRFPRRGVANYNELHYFVTGDKVCPLFTLIVNVKPWQFRPRQHRVELVRCGLFKSTDDLSGKTQTALTPCRCS